MADDPGSPAAGEGVPARAPFPWRDFLIDKAFELVLIPVGFFAALWLQGVIDDRREDRDYRLLLKDFQAEIAENLKETRALERYVGPVSHLAGDAVLGPLKDAFDGFQQGVTAVQQGLRCTDDLVAILRKDAWSDADDRAFQECEGHLQRMEEGAAGQHFQAIEISPLYHREVWQVYLQDGIRLFQDAEAKRLGLRLGSAYAKALEVERLAADVEEAVNGAFMRQIGGMEALVQRLADLFPEEEEGEGLEGRVEAERERLDRAALAQVHGALPGLLERTRDARYGMLVSERVAAMKVEALKRTVQDMNRACEDLLKDLQAEVDRMD